MDDSIQRAGTMQLLDPDPCLRDVKGIVALRITQHHGVEQLLGFLLTSGAQARPGRLQGARSGQRFGINSRANRLSRDKPVKALGNIRSGNHMRISGLLQLFRCRQDRLDIAARLAMPVQFPHRHHGSRARCRLTR